MKTVATDLDQGRETERRTAALVLQSLAAIDMVASDSDRSSESFEFRDDIVIDAISGALELVRLAGDEALKLSVEGFGPKFPSHEPEGCIFMPMAGQTDRFPVDIVNTALERVEGILTVLIASTDSTGCMKAHHVAVTNALWAATGQLGAAVKALSRVSYLSSDRHDRLRPS